MKAEKCNVKFLSNKLKEFRGIKFHIVSQVTVFDKINTGVIPFTKICILLGLFYNIRIHANCNHHWILAFISKVVGII
jgi:hypothetical protein